MDHRSRAVLNQTQVDAKTNEITGLQPLLEDLDLTGQIITAHAMHTQREHADWLVTEQHAAYLLVVKANQPGLYHQLPACRGVRSRSPTTPATAVTAAPRSAACRSPPSPAWTSPTPPRPCASPAGLGRLPAGAGAP
jgi:hypothetical protein